MENHDEFNRKTVEVLGRLYELFPAQTNIDTSKLGDSTLTAYTIDFWSKAGLISVGQTAEGFDGQPHFFFVGLTMSGLAALRSSWKDVGTAGTLGDRLVGLTCEAGIERTQEINDAITELLKYITS